MSRKTIDMDKAKKELKRISGILAEPHLLIGGLAVNQYYKGRQSKDIDLVCDHDIALGIINQLYKSDKWKIDEENDDEYRPAFVIKPKHRRELGTIMFGPKILEREQYENMDWEHLYEDSSPFKYKQEVYENILVPCPESLAYTKLISACNRVDNPKSDKDFEDFIDLLNHDSFRINKLVGLFEKNKSTRSIAKTAFILANRSSEVWERSPLSYLFKIINGDIGKGPGVFNIDHSALFFGNQKAFGYSYEEIIFSDELFLDGASKFGQEFYLRCDSGNVKTREHAYSLFEGGINNPRTTIKILEGNQKVKYRTRVQGDSLLTNTLRFQPKVKSGEYLRYKIEVNRDIGCYYMTQDELYKAIQENNHPGNWPFEYIAFMIKYPTKRLTISMIFPENYEPDGSGDFTAYSSHSMETIESERNRLVESNSFVKEVSKNKQLKMSISVDFPLMGVSYALRWMPIEADDYSDLIGKANESHQLG